ncbi:MAG: glycosyltransferase family 4 protein, partial [Endomicrobia bacterium]|nr:glycosyltransferase family 4 protein [Endomicrobiia bacterium]
NYIREIDVVPFKYFLSVGSFVPEKGFVDIIEAFTEIENKYGWKLVLAGNVEHKSSYYKQLIKKLKNSEDVIIIENPSEEILQELFSNAGVFISASSYEAAPTYLITAISYNLPVIASSIEANIVVGKEYPYYYPQGNIFALRYYITKFIKGELKFNIFNRELIRDYDWSYIADTVEDVYRKLAMV